jgi:hypothetical protein
MDRKAVLWGIPAPEVFLHCGDFIFVQMARYHIISDSQSGRTRLCERMTLPRFERVSLIMERTVRRRDCGAVCVGCSLWHLVVYIAAIVACGGCGPSRQMNTYGPPGSPKFISKRRSRATALILFQTCLLSARPRTVTELLACRKEQCARTLQQILDLVFAVDRDQKAVSLADCDGRVVHAHFHPALEYVKDLNSRGYEFHEQFFSYAG